MARTYALILPPLAVTVAQDLIEIQGVVGKALILRRVRIAAVDTTAPGSQMLSWRMSLLTAATVGTGGGAVTPARTDPGDPAATFTAARNNTGKATGTGTIFYQGADHVFNGLDETFDGIVMKSPPVIASSVTAGSRTLIVIELLSVVTPTVTLGGIAEVEEWG